MFRLITFFSFSSLLLIPIKSINEIIMISTLRKYSRKTRTYNAPVTVVQDGLAVTPSEMLRSCNSGIPISSQLLSASNFDDGEVSPLTDVPFLLRRGVDVGDVINYERSCRDKVSSAFKKSKSNSTN